MSFIFLMLLSVFEADAQVPRPTKVVDFFEEARISAPIAPPDIVAQYGKIYLNTHKDFMSAGAAQRQFIVAPFGQVPYLVMREDNPTQPERTSCDTFIDCGGILAERFALAAISKNGTSYILAIKLSTQERTYIPLLLGDGSSVQVYDIKMNQSGAIVFLASFSLDGVRQDGLFRTSFNTETKTILPPTLLVQNSQSPLRSMFQTGIAITESGRIFFSSKKEIAGDWYSVIEEQGPAYGSSNLVALRFSLTGNNSPFVFQASDNAIYVSGLSAPLTNINDKLNAFKVAARPIPDARKFRSGAIQYWDSTEAVAGGNYFVVDSSVNKTDFVLIQRTPSINFNTILTGKNFSTALIQTADILKVDSTLRAISSVHVLAVAQSQKADHAEKVALVNITFSGGAGSALFWMQFPGCKVNFSRIPQGSLENSSMPRYASYSFDVANQYSNEDLDNEFLSMRFKGCYVASTMMALNALKPSSFSLTDNPSIAEINRLDQDWEFFRSTVKDTYSEKIASGPNQITLEAIKKFYNEELASMPEEHIDYVNYDDEAFFNLSEKQKLQYIKEYVCNGLPLHIRVPGLSNPAIFGHSVVAYGTSIKETEKDKFEETILIKDPSKQKMEDIHHVKIGKKIGGARAFLLKKDKVQNPIFEKLHIYLRGDAEAKTNQSPYPVKARADTEYFPFIFNDDSIEAVPQEGDAPGTVYPVEIIKNYYLDDALPGNYSFEIVPNGTGEYTVDFWHKDQDGNTIKYKSFKGSGSEAPIIFNYNLEAGERVFADFESAAIDPVYANSPGQDTVKVTGRLPTSAQGFFNNTQAVDFLSYQLGLNINLVPGAFQRISGGYRFTQTVSSGITLIKIMDDRSFELRAVGLDLSGVSKESLQTFQLSLANRYFTGKPISLPVLTLMAPKIGAIGQVLNLQASLNQNSANATYAWEIISKPSGSTTSLSSSNTNMTALIPDRAGQYAIRGSAAVGSLQAVPVLATILVRDTSVPGPIESPSNGFIRILSDQTSYLIGETATISLQITSQPTNAANEYFFDASLNANPVSFLEISETEKQYVSPVFSNSGEQIFKVVLYMQNRAATRQLENAITHYQAELLKIEDALRYETNPEKIAELEEKRNSYNTQIEHARTEIIKGRTKIGNDAVLRFSVLSPEKRKK